MQKNHTTIQKNIKINKPIFNACIIWQWLSSSANLANFNTSVPFFLFRLNSGILDKTVCCQLIEGLYLGWHRLSCEMYLTQ